MSISISSIQSVTPGAGLPAAGSSLLNRGSSPFSSVLEKAIEAVEAPGRQADQAVQNFLNGENEELHTVALATQRASLAFDLGLQVRNKIVSAYQEVMRMQV